MVPRPWYSVKLDAKIREVATRKYPIKYNNRIYIYNTILKEFHTKIHVDMIVRRWLKLIQIHKIKFVKVLFVLFCWFSAYLV